jgi:hypothetical protein
MLWVAEHDEQGIEVKSQSAAVLGPVRPPNPQRLAG